MNASHTPARQETPPTDDAPGRHAGDVKPDRAAPLPHERDQSSSATDSQPRDVIKQAKRDIDAGQVDTDMRATPGLDAARREQLVPTPAKKP